MHPTLVRAVKDLGYSAPTPVQAAAIPPALEGRDILASAATGSGKSAAFGLPILNSLIGKKRGTTRALILVPTRELALQITEHLRWLAKYNGDIKIAAILGGVGFRGQLDAFRRGSDIIVATPGRLLDIMGQGLAKLETVDTLVLDEADRMLDMGFLPAVRKVVKALTGMRQTLLFSATIPPEIAKLTGELLDDPVRVNLAPTSKPVDTVAQAVYTVPQERKTDLLVELLKDNNIFSAIVFTRTKARADRLAVALAKRDVLAERIHGDRSQSQRTRALANFKRGKYRVLVATDIAARGIDIEDLGHVVNYDVPAVPEDYVHRVGRTARAAKTGDAITFVSHEEERLFAQIERSLGKRLDRSKMPELPPMAVPAFAARAPRQNPRAPHIARASYAKRKR
ncbi:MAG: DEAD/DEAH box helicase [Candidatus Eremiobacteraeota bacterium]|nr:DEAD/DEAH box helicase [Candidatus Eremiobacteraeota bacterium]